MSWIRFKNSELFKWIRVNNLKRTPPPLRLETQYLVIYNAGEKQSILHLLKIDCSYYLQITLDTKKRGHIVI